MTKSQDRPRFVPTAEYSEDINSPYVLDRSTNEELSPQSTAHLLSEQAKVISHLDVELAHLRNVHKAAKDDSKRIAELERRLEIVRRDFEEERALKNEARALCDHRSSDSWVWMEDILENDLDSMSDGMAVNITAGRLRGLIEWELDRLVKWMDEGYTGVDRSKVVALGVFGLVGEFRRAIADRIYRNPPEPTERVFTDPRPRGQDRPDG